MDKIDRHQIIKETLKRSLKSNSGLFGFVVKDENIDKVAESVADVLALDKDFYENKIVCNTDLTLDTLKVSYDGATSSDVYVVLDDLRGSRNYFVKNSEFKENLVNALTLLCSNLQKKEEIESEKKEAEALEQREKEEYERLKKKYGGQ